MKARLHDSGDEFRAVAEPWYRRDPIVHTIELTQLRAPQLPADSLMLTVWEGSELVAAALRTPPYPLLITGLGAAGTACAANALAQVRCDLDGIRGVQATASAFADAWCAVTGRAARVTMRERLYRLGSIRTPEAVAGQHRRATTGDRRLLVEWIDGFFVEAGGDEPDSARCESYVDTAAQLGDRFVLWIVDRTPVSMAMVRAPACGVSRIGPVFTPDSVRGHGYGSAVTAAAARQAWIGGADDVVLFADLANPTSNAIYQRIGFEPVCDSLRIDFNREADADRA